MRTCTLEDAAPTQQHTKGVTLTMAAPGRHRSWRCHLLLALALLLPQHPCQQRRFCNISVRQSTEGLGSCGGCGGGGGGGGLWLVHARSSPTQAPASYSVPLRDRTQDLPGWQGELTP